tara:strand:- start:814 stop:927 length:114 start_codon:yes stop_codon:yes gene_type:complete
MRLTTKTVSGKIKKKQKTNTLGIVYVLTKQLDNGLKN